MCKVKSNSAAGVRFAVALYIIEHHYCAARCYLPARLCALVVRLVAYALIYFINYVSEAFAQLNFQLSVYIV